MTDRTRIHPAWIVLGALTVCMLAGSGLRAMFGAFIKPMEAEFGWSRSALSGVAAISLLLLGAAGPFVGRLADLWGPRLVMAVAVVFLGVGAGGARVRVRGGSHLAVLAPDVHVLRVRVHVERHGAHPLHAARARAQLHGDPGVDGPRRNGRDEHAGDGRLRVDLRSLRTT